MADDDRDDAAVAAAARTLYALPPAQFLAARATLVTQARTGGQAGAAARIGALRKPTLAASVVNRFTLADAASFARVDDLGTELRAAQAALDGAALRDLTTRRRALVAELAAAALAAAGLDAPTTAVRDEVQATFDAAVADPGVAARLGLLVRAEQYSGFGAQIEPGGEPGLGAVPSLRLLRGGRDTRPAPPRAAPSVAPAQRRQHQRMLTRAQANFDAALADVADAESGEAAAAARIGELTAQLAELTAELAAAKRDLEQSRRAVRATRAKRRESQSALDRAQRRLDADG